MTPEMIAAIFGSLDDLDADRRTSDAALILGAPLIDAALKLLHCTPQNLLRDDPCDHRVEVCAEVGVGRQSELKLRSKVEREFEGYF